MNKRRLFLAVLISLSAFGLTLTSCVPSSGMSRKEISAIQSVATIEEVQGLANKLIWLQKNAQNNSNYVMELDSNEKITEGISLLGEGKSNITITLKGVGANRTISWDMKLFSRPEQSSMFTVSQGVTLVLDNITLDGNKIRKLVKVNGGIFVMNEGSAVINGAAHGILNSIEDRGSGIAVYGNGIFLMKGGNISGNTNERTYSFGFVDEGKRIKVTVNQGRNIGGGGVHIQSGKFIKTGGTITDNSVNDFRRDVTSSGRRYQCLNNECIDFIIPSNSQSEIKKYYESVLGFGSQISFNCSEVEGIDSTIGPEMNFQVNVGFGNNVCTQINPIVKSAETEEALQKYLVAIQKMQAKNQDAMPEYIATIQKNPAAEAEAVQKLQKAMQEVAQEVQEAEKRYLEAASGQPVTTNVPAETASEQPTPADVPAETPIQEQ